MEDEKIIELFFSRDEMAIQAVNDKYGRYLSTVAHNILGNREDTEECLDDALIHAWNAIPPTRPVYLKAFLTKIVRNLSLNRVKESQAKKRGGGEYDIALEEVQEFLPDSHDLEDHIDGIVLKELIEHFLDGLPKKQRIVFVQRYFLMDPVLTIAEKNGMSESGVKTTLFRLRNRLKEYLEEEGIVI